MRRYRESWKARASLPVIMMYAYVCSIIWPPTQAHEARWVGLISSRVLLWEIAIAIHHSQVAN